MHSVGIQFSIRAALVAVALTVLATTSVSQAQAQSQTVNYSASVTVQNTFTVGGWESVTFGTVAAIASPTAGTQAQIVMQAIGGAASITQGSGGSESRILTIVAPEPGKIMINGAPPNTTLTITPGSTIQLVNPADSVATQFDFTPTAVAMDFNAVTDSAGDLNVMVGGTLKTRLRQGAGSESGGYTDGTYTGTYSVTLGF
ncbi:MAG: DUF4402 domain-containing protein [Alphaproteobacteria bacterium]